MSELFPEARAAWSRLNRAWLDMKLARAELAVVEAEYRRTMACLRLMRHDAARRAAQDSESDEF